MNNKLACVTLDMEPDYGDPQRNIRLLEKPEYFERFVGIVNKHGVKLTMFTVTSLFNRFEKQFDMLNARIPLEYTAHSFSHDPYRADTRDEINKSHKILSKLTDVPILGYRAPIGRISKDGLAYLLDLGFSYDASLYTSIRPGKFSYWNVDKPNIPFWITRGDAKLLEFPFTSLRGFRIVFGLSYIKLLGWGLYLKLWRLFGLPDIALALSHPHDFYFDELSGFLPPNLERLDLSRNSTRGIDYFDKMIAELKHQGYRFFFISEAYDHIKQLPDIKRIPLEKWT